MEAKPTKQILVVDDSASVRQQLRNLLEENGYRVVEGGNGQAGLEQARRYPVDLMIVDVNMPVMDGIEMIGKVRKLEGYATIPIFVLTTESGVAAAQRGKAAGATAWIVKPFKPELLLSGLQKVLGKS